MSTSLLTSLAAIVLLSCGCAKPVNPSFMVSGGEARRAIKQMAGAPRELNRPLVIVSGYLDPNVSATYIRAKIGDVTNDKRILKVVVGFHSNFEECRAELIEAVQRAFPGANPLWTAEVDVIGTSLGGLVARYAAAPEHRGDDSAVKEPRRLKVARMFTISSPHAGARLTNLGTLNQLHRDMRPNSPLMAYLAEQDKTAGYQLYPYVCKGDWIVGEEYAAPPGREPLWLAGHSLQLGLDPHRGSWYDARILADIFRRLRGEPAFSAVR